MNAFAFQVLPPALGRACPAPTLSTSALLQFGQQLQGFDGTQLV